MTLRAGDGCRLSNTEHSRPTLGSLRASDRGYRKASSAPLEAAPHSFDPWNTIGLGLRILVSLPCDPSLTLPKAESAFVMLCTRETTNSVQ